MCKSGLIVMLLLALASPAFAVAPGGVYPAGNSMTLALEPKPLPREVGYHLVRGTAVFHGRKVRFASGIFLPPAFLTARQPMPVLMALHNRFAIGLDGSNGLVGEGMGQLLARGRPDDRAEGEKPANPIDLRKEAQFIGLVPQCPAGFTFEDPAMADLLCKFIAQMVAAYHADDDRVYLTGFSYGASSSWRVALNAPDRFAAILCMDGRATPNPARDVEKLKDVAIYLEVGQWDGDFVKEADWMHQALNNLPHPNYIFRMIPGGNHFNYQAVYTDPAFWKWVYAQHRVHRPGTTQPAMLGAVGSK
jgi:predicted peptidase